MFKKIILSFLIFVLLFTSIFTPIASAQETGTWYNQDFNQWWNKVYDSPSSEIFGERYTAAQVEWIIYGLFAFVLNKTTGDPKTTSCLMNSDLEDCTQRLRDFFGVSTINNSSNLAQEQSMGITDQIFEDRPLSGITYFKNTLRKYSLIPEVKAQSPGFGFTVLEPILPMWRVARNFAYALAVIGIVVLAFMIMFRIKISPQVVITVQSALPKIAVGLVLITFSYAIVGFLVDLMYVVIGILSLFGKELFTVPFGIELPAESSTAIFNLLTRGQPTGLDIPFPLFGVVILFGIYLMFFAFSFLSVVGTLGTGVTIVSGLVASLTGILPVILILLLIAVLLFGLYLLFKTVWTLLKAFASVVLLTIFAPLQLALGIAIPTMGFSGWIRSILANLSVFVVVGALFLLSYVFLFQAMAITFVDIFGDSGLQALLKIIFGTYAVQGGEALLSGADYAAWPPLLASGTAGLPLLFLGVSLVILALVPKTSDIIKSVIERRPFTYGADLELAAKAGLPIAGYTFGELGAGRYPTPLDRILRGRRPGTKVQERAKTAQKVTDEASRVLR